MCLCLCACVRVCVCVYVCVCVTIMLSQMALGEGTDDLARFWVPESMRGGGHSAAAPTGARSGMRKSHSFESSVVVVCVCVCVCVCDCMLKSP